MPTIFPTRFDLFVEPARARSELWRTILGFLLIGALFVAGTVALSVAVLFVGEKIQLGLGWRLAMELKIGATPFATLALLGMLALMIPVLALVLHLLHHRDLRSLLGPTRRIERKIWLTSAGIVAVLVGLNVLVTLTTEDIRQQMPLLRWMLLLPVTIIAVFLQTSAEELVFRGYLQQQLAARFQSRWIWMGIPAVLFGTMHWNPSGFGANSALVVLVAVLMGLIASDLTARLGTLSASMGLHFANNLGAMIFVAVPGQLSGVSLFLYDADTSSGNTAIGLVVSMAVMIVAYGVFLVIHRRRRL